MASVGVEWVQLLCLCCGMSLMGVAWPFCVCHVYNMASHSLSGCGMVWVWPQWLYRPQLVCSGVIWYQWVWHCFSGCGIISSGLACSQCVWDINSGFV